MEGGKSHCEQAMEPGFIIPLSYGASEDKWMWHFESRERHSVRFGYRLAMELLDDRRGSRGSRDRDWWITLWGLNIPNKIKNFMWRAYNNMLLCQVALARRGIPCSKTCRRCEEGEETTWHALWLCSEARQVWDSCAIWQKIKRLNVGSLMACV